MIEFHGVESFAICVILHRTGFFQRVLNSAIFRPLGKVTYAVFLCHLFVIRATLGNIRQPIYVSDVRIVSAAVGPAV